MKYTKIGRKSITTEISIEGTIMTLEDEVRPIRFQDGSLGLEFAEECIAVRVFDADQLESLWEETAREAGLQLTDITVLVSTTYEGQMSISVRREDGYGYGSTVGQDAVYPVM